MRIVLSKTIKADRIYRKGEQFSSPFPKPIAVMFSEDPSIAMVLDELPKAEAQRKGAEFEGFAIAPVPEEEAVRDEVDDLVHAMRFGEDQKMDVSLMLRPLSDAHGGPGGLAKALGVSRGYVYNWLRGSKADRKYFAKMVELYDQ